MKEFNHHIVSVVSTRHGSYPYFRAQVYVAVLTCSGAIAWKKVGNPKAPVDLLADKSTYNGAFRNAEELARRYNCQIHPDRGGLHNHVIAFEVREVARFIARMELKKC